MDRKDWNKIGLVAAVVLVPGGFVLGALLAAQRMRAGAVDAAPVASADDDKKTEVAIDLPSKPARPRQAKPK